MFFCLVTTVVASARQIPMLNQRCVSFQSFARLRNVSELFETIFIGGGNDDNDVDDDGFKSIKISISNFQLTPNFFSISSQGCDLDNL